MYISRLNEGYHLINDQIKIMIQQNKDIIETLEFEMVLKSYIENILKYSHKGNNRVYDTSSILISIFYGDINESHIDIPISKLNEIATQLGKLCGIENRPFIFIDMINGVEINKNPEIIIDNNLMEKSKKLFNELFANPKKAEKILLKYLIGQIQEQTNGTNITISRGKTNLLNNLLAAE